MNPSMPESRGPASCEGPCLLKESVAATQTHGCQGPQRSGVPDPALLPTYCVASGGFLDLSEPFPPTPSTYLASFHLRAFAHAVPSAQNTSLSILLCPVAAPSHPRWSVTSEIPLQLPWTRPELPAVNSPHSVPVLRGL